MTDLTDVELTQVASHLLARYAWAIDDRAYDDLLEVFTDDVVADYGAFTCSSAAELVARMEELHRDLRTTQHLVGSVHACGEADSSATVRSHVRATLVRGSGEGGRVEVAATYRDRLVVAATGPRIAERHVEGRWISGDRDILPWFRQREPRPPSSEHVGAPDATADDRRVDRSQTTKTVTRSTGPNDRGI